MILFIKLRKWPDQALASASHRQVGWGHISRSKLHFRFPRHLWLSVMYETGVQSEALPRKVTP